MGDGAAGEAKPAIAADSQTHANLVRPIGRQPLACAPGYRLGKDRSTDRTRGGLLAQRAMGLDGISCAVHP
jgi:hypothetical protein